jgi:hypothetical protein
MPRDLHGFVIALFLATWIVLLAVSFGVFYFGRNAALKRKWFPPFVMLVGILFVAFVAAINFTARQGQLSWDMIVFAACGSVLFTYLNLKLTKFCDHCGVTVVPQMVRLPKFCPRCGASQVRDQRASEEARS